MFVSWFVNSLEIYYPSHTPFGKHLLSFKAACIYRDICQKCGLEKLCTALYRQVFGYYLGNLKKKTNWLKTPFPFPFGKQIITFLANKDFIIRQNEHFSSNFSCSFDQGYIFVCTNFTTNGVGELIVKIIART